MGLICKCHYCVLGLTKRNAPVSQRLLLTVDIEPRDFFSGRPPFRPVREDY